MTVKWYQQTATVEAVQWDGTNHDECRAFLGNDYLGLASNHYLCVNTPEGPIHGGVGYWLVRGPAGNHYLCDPDIFTSDYQEVDP